MITVKILRGDFLAPLVFEHADRKSALRRADAACDLHGARITERSDTEIVVDADHYYGSVASSRAHRDMLKERYPETDYVIFKVTYNDGRVQLHVRARNKRPCAVDLDMNEIAVEVIE